MSKRAPSGEGLIGPAADAGRTPESTRGSAPPPRPFPRRRRKIQNLKLLEHNSKLKGAISDMGSHQTDVYVYIHEKLDEYSDQIAAYEARVAELEADAVRLKEERDRDVDQGRADAEEEILRLTTQLDSLTDELARVHEFQAERDEVLRDRDELRESLDSERRGREEDRAVMERTKIAEKQRLKDEMLRRVQEAKEAILADTVQQLHDTTKRTLAENEQMTTELAYQSRAVEDLLKRVTTLETQRDKLRRRLALRESEADALTRRNHALEQMMNALRRAARGAGAASPRTMAPVEGEAAVSHVSFASPAPARPRPARPPAKPSARKPQAPGAPPVPARPAAFSAPSAARPAPQVRDDPQDRPRAGAAALAAERRRARVWERRYMELSERMRRAVASRDALVGAMGEGLVVLSGVLQAPAGDEGGRPSARGMTARRLLEAVEEEGRELGPAAALGLVVRGVRDAVAAAEEAEEAGDDGSGPAYHSLLVRSVLGDDADDAGAEGAAHSDAGGAVRRLRDGWASVPGRGGGAFGDDRPEAKEDRAALWSESAGDLDAPSLLSLPSTVDGGASLAGSASAAPPPAAPLRAPASSSSAVDFQRSSAASAVRLGRKAGERRTHGVARLGRGGGAVLRLSASVASAGTVTTASATAVGLSHQPSTADAGAAPRRPTSKKPRVPHRPAP